MIEVVPVERLKQHVAKTVCVRGWLYNLSSKGKLHFAQVRDGSGIVQCVVFKNNVPPELFEALGHAGQESSLTLTGMVREDPRAPGGVEIDVTQGEILQSVQGYPITPKEHGIDFELVLPHRRFHRHIGVFAGTHFDPKGNPLTKAEWDAQKDAWLPSDADRAYVASLMRGVHEPGKMASWIAPPTKGINSQPVDWTYVRFA